MTQLAITKTLKLKNIVTKQRVVLFMNKAVSIHGF